MRRLERFDTRLSYECWGQYRLLGMGFQSLPHPRGPETSGASLQDLRPQFSCRITRRTLPMTSTRLAGKNMGPMVGLAGWRRTVFPSR